MRDWTPDVRALVRALDARVQAGTMHWKYAVNVLATATKMCGDAVSSKCGFRAIVIAQIGPS